MTQGSSELTDIGAGRGNFKTPTLREVARTAPYMTDAANLLKVYAGAPTVVLGPGEAAMAHQTDEYCHVERLRQSVEIYEKIIQDWCFAPA